MIASPIGLVPLKRSSAASARLIAFAYAGGSVASFMPFRRSLPSEIELLGAEYPGHGSRSAEPAVSDIGRIAQDLAEEIAQLDERRCVLLGYSFGGFVAYETARLLERRGHVVARLIVCACAPPPSRIVEHGGELDDETIIARMRSYPFTPASVLESPELLALVVARLRADWSASRRYTTAGQEPIAAPVAAYGGLQDPAASAQQLNGWRQATRGTVTLRMFPGGHAFVEESRALVAEALCADVLS